MRPDTRLLLALNGLVPRPNLPGRVDPLDYSAWEYKEAERHVRMMHEAGLSLQVPFALDLGCGLGGKSVYIAERGPERMVGLDIKQAHVDGAKAFAAQRGAHNIAFTRGDAGRLPFRDGSLNLVVTTDTFEHFPDPEAVLADLGRVLAPGGKLAALFGPWNSPLGSHLYEKINVPWCHVFWPGAAIEETVRHIAAERGRSLDAEAAARESAFAEEQIRYYYEDCNRMSLGRFRRVLGAEKRLRVRVWQKHAPDKLKALSPLLPLPVFEELLTGILVLVAERV